jgi:hypothetical protein
MSRRLFTVGYDVYAFDAELRRYFIDLTQTDHTTDIWFDNTRLYHTYRQPNSDTIETEWADIIETLGVRPTDARELLDAGGIRPVIDSQRGLWLKTSAHTLNSKN